MVNVTALTFSNNPADFDWARLDFDPLEAEGGSIASLPLYVVLPMALAAGLLRRLPVAN